jgi:hypothetical protein
MFTSIKTKSSKQYIQPPHLYDTPKMRKIMKGVGVRLYKQGKKNFGIPFQGEFRQHLQAINNSGRSALTVTDMKY